MLRSGEAIDRREVPLVAEGLPSMPHHHEGQKLPIDEAVALVAKVRASAQEHAKVALAALAETVDAELEGVALRALPGLPPTVAERITDYRAMCVADWVMYREVIAEAATKRGWRVAHFEPSRVLDEAASKLGRALDPLFDDARARFGPPWRKEHRMAMAGAIVAFD
ncbi:MAG: hypothetical protein H6722_25815 [Sandaracinus sp.]|nr:hypothetical protein [Sandaracinus sp.]